MEPLKQSAGPSAAGVVSAASPYPVAETLERMESAIRARGLTLFAHIDHSGEAERIGLSMQPAHVLIFGAPQAGTPVMIAAPLLALDLPLKTLIWQDAHGGVWVSYTTPASLAARYGIPDELIGPISGVEPLVAAALRP